MRNRIIVSTRTPLPWPRIKRIMSVNNGDIEVLVVWRGDIPYVQGHLKQKIVYVDWKSSLRLFQEVISFDQPVEISFLCDCCKPQVQLIQHSYRADLSGALWSRSRVEQTFLFALKDSNCKHHNQLSTIGLEKLEALLPFSIDDQEISSLKKETCYLSTPAKKVNSLEISVNSLDGDIREGLFNYAVHADINIYYEGTDGKQHYDQSSVELLGYTQCNGTDCFIEWDCRTNIQLISYRLSMSGYRVTVDFLLTLNLTFIEKEKRDVWLGGSGKVICQGVQVVPVWLEVVKEQVMVEEGVQSEIYLPLSVQGVNEVKGRIDICGYQGHQGAMIVNGTVTYDIYYIDDQGRQRIWEEEKKLSLPIDCSSEVDLLVQLRPACTIKNIRVEPTGSKLSVYSVLTVEGCLVRWKMVDLIAYVAEQQEGLEGKRYSLKEVVYSEVCQIYLDQDGQLDRSARRILDNKVTMVELEWEQLGNIVIISGTLEQELAYVSIEDAVCLHKDKLDFTHQLVVPDLEGEVLVRVEKIDCLPALLHMSTKVEARYGLTLNLYVTVTTVCQLPTNSENHQSIPDVWEEKGRWSIEIPVPYCGDDINISLEYIGLDHRMNARYVHGNLLLVSEQAEEEIIFSCFLPTSLNESPFHPSLFVVEAVDIIDNNEGEGPKAVVRLGLPVSR